MKNQQKVLFILQCFTALMALPAGIFLVFDPDGSSIGLPLNLLKNSPFEDFLIPGIFLFLINGIGQSIGAILTFIGHKHARKIGIGLGVFLVLWIAIQYYYLGGSVHILQFVFFSIGIVQVWLSYGIQSFSRSTTLSI